MPDRAPLVDQPTATPTRKVTAATLGAAAATLVVYALTAFAGADVPPGVEGALATLLAMAAGYVVRERDAPTTSGT